MKRHKISITVFCFALVVVLLVPGKFSQNTFAVEGDNSATSQHEQQTDDAKFSEKNEIVYANLSGTGEVDDVYVVNEFDVSNSGTLSDYGDYTEVTNITTEDSISKQNDKITVPVKQGQFYYQGTLNSKTLPWSFKIAYALDGKQIEQDELLDKDGKLEITLKSAKNNDVDKVFYDNYMLQISLRLDSEKCSNVLSGGATIASEGKNKLVTHTVLKGKDADIKITADVQNFSMSGFEIAAMPFSMDIEMPDTDELTGDMTTLSDAISELNDGVGELASGSRELSNGTGELVSGSSELSNGLSLQSGGSNKLTSGSAQIKVALDKISSELNKQGSGDMGLGDMAQLPLSLRQMAKGLNDLSGGLTQLKDGYSAMLTILDGAITAIPDGTASETDIMSLYGVVTDPAQQAILNQLAAGYAASLRVKGTYLTPDPATGVSIQVGMNAVVTNLGLIISGDGTNDNPGIKGLITGLNTMADGIEKSLDGNEMMEQMKELSSGMSTLAKQYGDFHAGLKQYTGGMDQIATEYKKFHDGLSTISSGTRELSNGTQKLYEGTTELNNEVADLPDTMKVEIDKLMKDYDGSDFEAKSFTSTKNTNIEMVQFVIMSEAIEEKKEEVPPEEDEKKGSFWTRFLDLFK